MNRDGFRSRAESSSTKKGYDKAFKKFDSWLVEKEITESELMSQIKELETHERFEVLQELIGHIEKSVSPAVVRKYFEIIFMYLILSGAPLDYDQKRIRLKFPRIAKKRLDGLDKNKIEALLRQEDSILHKVYYTLLFAGGLRETEALRVTPAMFEFGVITRLKLPDTITKFKIQRETMLAPIPAKRIKEFIKINDYRNNDLIFIKTWNDENDLIPFEKHFARLRTKAGLDTVNRQKHQQNDITLHSFRSFFITILTDHGLESFAHALTGHSKYMDTYYRSSLETRIKKFAGVSEFINF